MKKFTAIILSLSFVLCLFAACGKTNTGTDKTEEKVQDGFHYVILDDGSAKIVKYDAHDYQEKLTIPSQFGEAKVTVIGESAFEGSDRLNEVTLPTYITTIEKKAFYGSTIHNAFMVSSRELVTIEDQAFAECTKLIQVDIPSSLTTFGKSVFENDAGILVFTFRGDMKEIDPAIFTGANKKMVIWTYKSNTGIKAFAKDNSYEIKYLPQS